MALKVKAVERLLKFDKISIASAVLTALGATSCMGY